MATRTFTLSDGNGGWYALGSAPAHTYTRKGVIFAAPSYIYVCPTCGSVWGRADVLDSHTRYVALHAPCDEHSRYGRRWLPAWPDEIDLPPSAMADEILALYAECAARGKLDDARP